MPFYDYVYGTIDKSTDTLYETSLHRPQESPDAVHLTHLTTPESIYHLRLGFASLASKPHTSEWYLWLMWPVTFWSMMITRAYGKTFVVERNTFKNIKLQTWAIPKYSIQVRIIIYFVLISIYHNYIRILHFFVLLQSVPPHFWKLHLPPLIFCIWLF